MNRATHLNLPVNKNSATTVETLLDKSVCGWQMLQQVFVLNIIHFDNHVLEGGEEMLVYRHAKHRQDMSDIGLLESIALVQGGNATMVLCYFPFCDLNMETSYLDWSGTNNKHMGNTYPAM